MKVKIQIDIPDEILEQINEIIKDLGISLNEYIEKALKEALEKDRHVKNRNLITK